MHHFFSSVYMLQKAFLFVVLILAIGVTCGLGQGVTSNDTIKIDTRLVSVPVIVSDRDGRYVPNLTAADFTVFQDGLPQKIEFFAATEEPLTIALLIDTSQSTRAVLDDIKDSARSFIKLLRVQDRAMIVSFDSDTHVLSQLTSDHEQLNRAVKNADIPFDFGTTLRDAAYQTINRSFGGIKGRKAIILLTDGKDVGSRISSRELLHALQESDTLIYTIMFTPEPRMGRGQFPLPSGGRRNGGIFGGRFPRGPGDGRRNDRIERKNEEAEVFLRELSYTTAGRFYSSKDGKLKQTFANILDELRFQYRLGFYPPEETVEKDLHELKVKVSRPEAVVRARTGYRVQNKQN